MPFNDLIEHLVGDSLSFLKLAVGSGRQESVKRDVGEQGGLLR